MTVLEEANKNQESANKNMFWIFNEEWKPNSFRIENYDYIQDDSKSLKKELFYYEYDMYVRW